MSDFTMTHYKPERTGAAHGFPPLRMILQAYLTRRALMDLTPRQRADIGISSSAALTEAARLPWDIDPTARRPRATTPSAFERLRARYLAARLDTQ
jgi:uncharacterized protein DUF1127